MRLTQKITLLSLLSLLAACTPIEQKLPTSALTAPIITQAPIADNATAEKPASEIQPKIKPEEQPQEQPEIQAEIQPDPQPDPQPEPAPQPDPIDPLDPHRFYGQSQTTIEARIGLADFAFRDQAIIIAHYRDAACQILLFFKHDEDAAAKGAIMTHLDIRPLSLEGTVNLPACYAALGKRAHDSATNSQ